jgi:succinate dehydrogenase / fumarate reductase cytochrome b subunit
VYFNVVNDFGIPWVVMVYIAAQIVLGLHLYHGGWSLLQSLGLTHPVVNDRRRVIAQTIASLVVIGNISIPVAVLAGFVTY